MSERQTRRILIDGSMARSGGGFTYLVNILPRMAALAPDDRFRVLLRSERLASSIAPAPNLQIDLLPDGSWAQRLRFTYREVPRLVREWGADLYFSAGESAPLRTACPMIASFRNPNVYTALNQGWSRKQQVRLRLLREISRLSAYSCDRIMFVSEDSARWIGDSLHIPEARRAVVHHGIDATAWTPPKRSTLAHGSYILSVSSIYRYKNFVRLIEAYAALAHRRDDLPDLVIVGDDQDPEYSARMRSARDAAGELAGHIHLLGEVPYAEIRRYYAGADLFVFPSYLETFGHPLLEAMVSGVPTVAADIPVFREIAGDAAFYADPHKPEALASAMEEALFAPRAREALIKRGRDRVRSFGWDATARRLSELFDEVLAERQLTARAA
jgi:glycosyltransferase involved in cell wall biosynthesis